MIISELQTNSPIPSFKNCAMHSGSCIQQSKGKFEHGEQLERQQQQYQQYININNLLIPPVGV